MRKIFLLFVLAFVPVFVFGQSECNAAQNFNLKPNLQNLTTGEVYSATVRYDIDFLALRSGPSTSYPILVRIPPGARVTVYRSLAASFPERGYYDYDNNFVDCDYQGVRGFAHSGYIINVQLEGYRP